MNIKVAVRVRPFVPREIEMRDEACVKMEGQSVFVLAPDGSQERAFTYDHCFWSHDGFLTLEDGLKVPAGKDSKYADQRRVYDSLGREILENAIQGYNCCLFAYGQTGSGKSYSIFGYGVNKGIVPMICNELLDGKQLVNEGKRSFSLSVSMLEIYNERIQDLLIPVRKRPKEGLKIREHPKIGVFVEDLKKEQVTSYAQIEEVIETGNKNKTLGATLMNATSSRAHTIIVIELIQNEETQVKTTQKTSVINLVDLAGSEKVGKTEATGDRLKEACSINKSLTTLGIVINQLYLKAEGAKNTISYRDSSLTRLLQNALGGNSKTIMICAISPARDNYDETLSTLRYADQAKRIKLEARVNQSETDKLIHELMEENDKLKKLLADFKARKDEMGIDQIEGQIKGLEIALNATSLPRVKSITGGLSLFSKERAPEVHKERAGPYMTNLNEDPLLSNKIVYEFNENPLIQVGREVENSTEEDSGHRIILNGVGIKQNHAIFEYKNEELRITAWDSTAAANVFVNGEPLKADSTGKPTRILSDLDRVIIGTSSTFLIRLLKGTKPMIEGKNIDWEFCQLEKFKRQEKNERDSLQKQFDEKLASIKANEQKLKEQHEEAKIAIEQTLEKQKAEYSAAISALEAKYHAEQKEKLEAQKLIEEQKNNDAVAEIEKEQKSKELEFFKTLENLKKESKSLELMKNVNAGLEKKLITYYPQIQEANAIARELNRNILFHPFVASLDLFGCHSAAGGDLIVNVRVENFEEGWVNYWSLEKFEDRMQLIREAIEYYFTHNKVNYSAFNDPFWDPNEPILYGEGLCILKNVLYRFEFQKKLNLLGYQGEIGNLNLKLSPVDEEGKPVNEDEMDELVEEPIDLIKKEIPCNFKVVIDSLFFYDISNLVEKTLIIKYEVFTTKGFVQYTTQPRTITNNLVPIEHSQLVTIRKVDPEIIDFYLYKSLNLKIYVSDIETIPKKGKLEPPSLAKKNLANKNENEESETLAEDKDVLPAFTSLLEPKDETPGSERNICSIF